MGKKSERRPQIQPGTQAIDTVHQGILGRLKRHLEKPIYKFLSYLVVFLTGSGVVWPIFQLEIQRENQANDIRKVIIGLHEKILDINNSMNEASASSSGDKLTEKISSLQVRLDFYLDEYTKWDSKLAQIEGRSPSKLDFFPPNPPYNLTVK